MVQILWSMVLKFSDCQLYRDSRQRYVSDIHSPDKTEIPTTLCDMDRRTFNRTPNTVHNPGVASYEYRDEQNASEAVSRCFAIPTVGGMPGREPAVIPLLTCHAGGYVG